MKSDKSTAECAAQKGRISSLSERVRELESELWKARTVMAAMWASGSEVGRVRIEFLETTDTSASALGMQHHDLYPKPYLISGENAQKFIDLFLSLYGPESGRDGGAS